MRRRGLKRYALLLLPLFIAACQETVGPADENETSLVVSRVNISLSNLRPADSSIVSLLCGCRFTLDVESVTGDTNVIHYAEHDATTTEAYRIALALTADTSAIGNHSATFAILSTGFKGTYRDTIRVTYSRD